MQAVWTVMSLMPDAVPPNSCPSRCQSLPRVPVPAAGNVVPKKSKAQAGKSQPPAVTPPTLPARHGWHFSPHPSSSQGKGREGGSSPTPSCPRPVVVGEGLQLWKVGRGSLQQPGEWKK